MAGLPRPLSVAFAHKGIAMDDDLISVRDIAAQHGKRKQTVFKIIKRLGIETTKQRSF